MVANGAESSDFYQVLGLKKGCTDVEVKNAYKKLAMRWHPDRCSAFGSSKHVEEAKKKFQAIQEAYSVLSNENKRFLYDVGVYDSDDDENGMSDFLTEMAEMMSQNKPAENGEESFEQLKNLFDEMFQSDIESLDSSSQTGSSTSYSSLFSSCGESSYSNKRGSSEMSNTKAEEPELHEFCIGAGYQLEGVGTRERGLRERVGANRFSSSFGLPVESLDRARRSIVKNESWNLDLLLVDQFMYQ